MSINKKIYDLTIAMESNSENRQEVYNTLLLAYVELITLQHKIIVLESKVKS